MLLTKNGILDMKKIDEVAKLNIDCEALQNISKEYESTIRTNKKIGWSQKISAGSQILSAGGSRYFQHPYLLKVSGSTQKMAEQEVLCIQSGTICRFKRKQYG